MTNRRAGWVCITLLFLFGLFLWTSNAPAAEPEVLGQKLSGSVEVGGRSVAGNTDSSKFNEYRDDKDGVSPFIEDLKLNLDSKDGKRYFEFRATDPAYRDQNYKLNLGSYNLYDVQFEFDQTPHVLSNTATTSYRDQGDGSFTLDDAKTGSTALAATNTEGRDLSLDRYTGKFGFRYTPLPEWDFRLGFSSERQKGRRAMSLNQSFSFITEVVEPIQYWTHNLSASAEYSRNNYNVKLGYDLSLFRNDLDKVLFDSHRFTAPVSSTNSDRFQAGTYPDNVAHTFSLSSAVHLPAKSRFVGTASYSVMLQDQDLLPYTVNGAIQTPQGLPRGSADTQANNMFLNLVLTNQAIRNLGLKAHYRYFNRENKTDSARFYEVIADNGSQQAAGTLTAPQSFHDQMIELEGDWHVARWATWKIAVERETADNSRAEGRKLRENIVKSSFNLTPAGWLQIRPSYEFGKRKANYTPSAAEFPLFRKWSEFDRTRNQAGLEVSVTPTDILTFSLGSTYALDDYTETDYGLRKARVNTYTADVSVAPAQSLSLYANYVREEARRDLNKRYRTPTSDEIANDWETKTTEVVDTVGVGADVVIIPEKLDAGVSYALSFAHTDQRNKNLNATTQASATVADWPEVKNKFTTINTSLRYKPRKNLTTKIRYTYDRYWEDDFYQDSLRPNMGDNNLFLGATQPSYAAHIVALSVKLEF